MAEEENPEISALENDWFLIEGGTSIRDINRHLNWSLPTDGPKTLNGLIVEELENIPEGHIGFKLGDYRIETASLSEKMIESAKVKSVHS